MFKKIAQEVPPPAPAPAPAPEAAPAAPVDLGMPAGLPDLGSMGLPSPPPAPSTPMASPTGGERQEILSPIESISQIFYDMDVVNFVENNLHINANELTRKILLDHGGK